MREREKKDLFVEKDIRSFGLHDELCVSIDDFVEENIQTIPILSLNPDKFSN
jgi:hypothetical protein